MTTNDRSRKLFFALEANTDGRKAAIEMIRRFLCEQAEDCATVADRRVELEKKWAADSGLRANADVIAIAQEIGAEIRGMTEGKE